MISTFDLPDSTTTTTTTTFNTFLEPTIVDVIEKDNCIEFIYKEMSQCSFGGFLPETQDKVFKIIFSCKDGVWNKSERIYGEIVPERDEQYIF
ncbi:MAG: hypothetical protein GY928_01930 [Colwellia sp.]|nr:hypothetical protein [Colwellia sp.]